MRSTIFKPVRQNNMRFTYNNCHFFKDKNFCLGMAIVILAPGAHKPGKVTAGTRLYKSLCFRGLIQRTTVRILFTSGKRAKVFPIPVNQHMKSGCRTIFKNQNL